MTAVFATLAVLAWATVNMIKVLFTIVIPALIMIAGMAWLYKRFNKT